MTEQSLQDRFPEMQPVQTPPALFTLNGFGLSVYGERDLDHETGTFIKTHCLTALFIPVLAIGAYRVAHANDGWYFLGKEPLSGVAKGWNVLVLSAVLVACGLVGWLAYTDSPEYRAQQKLAQADRLVEEGSVAQAAKLYGQLGAGYSPAAVLAIKRLGQHFNGSAAESSSLAAATLLKNIVELINSDDWPDDGESLAPRAVELANQFAGQDPAGAMDLLDTLKPIDSGPDFDKQRRALLERIVAEHPGNAKAAGEMAVIFESADELEKCGPLLMPHRDRLGQTEGARILGQIFARDGKFDEAHQLLLPYTEGRLTRLREKEAMLQSKYEVAQFDVLAKLNSGLGPPQFYQRYEQASKAEQDRIVNEYLSDNLKDNPQVKQAQAELIEAASIVPVALELGIVILRRGQAMSDLEERQAELEKAEKTFLSIQGVAGDSEEYRLYLGQVYYWLGRHEEGKKLFDELLASDGRSMAMLLAVSNVLRNVGEVTGARELAEEAYENSLGKEAKQNAASMRALLWVDTADRVLWLERANPSELHIRASLASSKGDMAFESGDLETAEQQYREAISLFEKQPESASTLNNAALTYFSLAQVSSDRTLFEQGLERMSKALALQPDNSILLDNATSSILRGVCRDIAGEQIDIDQLKSGSSISHLSFLYNDAESKRQLAERFRNHPGEVAAVRNLQSLLVLSPKNKKSYELLNSIYDFLQDEESLSALLGQLDKVEFDQGDSLQASLEYLAGENDEEMRNQLSVAIDRMQEIMEKIPADSRGATFAVAATAIVRSELTFERLGRANNADKVVQLAKEAYAAAPSSATRWALVAALTQRGGKAVADRLPEYAKLVESCRRTLSAGEQLAIGMAASDAIKQAALKNEDVQQALQLVVESYKLFPANSHAFSWALLRSSHPEHAEAIAKRLPEDRVEILAREIEWKLSPYNASVAYEVAWQREMSGKPDEAAEILRQCASLGVPLPEVKSEE